MRKKITYILIFILSATLFINNASAESVTFKVRDQRKGYWCLDYDTDPYYNSSPYCARAAGIYSTDNFNTINANCLQEYKSEYPKGTRNSSEVTSNNKFTKIKNMLYYGPHGPGYTDAIGAQMTSIYNSHYTYSNGSPINATFNATDIDKLYAYLHVALVYEYESTVLGKDTPATCPNGNQNYNYFYVGRTCGTYANDKAFIIELIDYLNAVVSEKGTPPSNFKVYFVDSSNEYEQDMIYWKMATVTPGKVCVRKKITNATYPNGVVYTGHSGEVEFGLYNNSTCTGTPIKKGTINTNGKVAFGNLTPGEIYYIGETAAPSGYEKVGGWNSDPGSTCMPVQATTDTDCIEATGLGTGNMYDYYNNKENGQICVDKTINNKTNTSSDSFKFSLYDGNDTNCSGTPIKTITITSSSTDAQKKFTGLPYGKKYYLKESEYDGNKYVATGINNKVCVPVVSTTSGQTCTVKKYNNKTTDNGEVCVKKRVIKDGEAVTISNMTDKFTFALYSDSNCKTIVKTQQRTNANGEVRFTGLAADTDYYIEESAWSDSNKTYEIRGNASLGGKCTKVRSTNNTTATCTTTYDNVEKQGCITVRKRIHNGGTTTTATNMAGDFKFTLYSDSECTSPVSGHSNVSIDSNGIATFSGLKLTNNYYVQETYNAHPETYTVMGNDNYGGTCVSVTETIYADEISCSMRNYANVEEPGSLCLQKKIRTNSGTVNDTSTNKFKVALYDEPTCVGTDGEPIAEKYFVNGVATFDNLSVGTYYAKEISIDDNYEDETGCTEVRATSTENPTCKAYTNGESYYCMVVVKKDADSAEEIGDSNTAFELKQGSTTIASETATVSGKKRTVYKYLKPDLTYTLKETQAPSGYFNNNQSYVNVSKADSDTKSNDEKYFKKMTYSNGTYNCDATTGPYYIMEDSPKYYCLMISKEDDSTHTKLTGATFSAKKSSSSSKEYLTEIGSSGNYALFTETDNTERTITEEEAPEGYQKISNTLSATPIALRSGYTESQARSKCLDGTAETEAGGTIASQSVVLTNSKNFINWYKQTENGYTTGAQGAGFKVRTSSGYIYYTGEKTSVQDENNTQKTCYQYGGVTSSSSSTTASKYKFISDSNGEVCISGVPSGDYTVEEVEPLNYHTFGTYYSVSLSAGVNFKAKDTSSSNKNTFVNKPTEFEFTKYVSEGDSGTWNSITTNELKKLAFNITDTNGNTLEFIKTSDGVYEYAGNTIDAVSGTRVTDLYLTDQRKFKVYHLPHGSFNVKEKKSCCDSACPSCSSTEECTGYFYPAYTNQSDYRFTISGCSNPTASGGTSCSTTQTETKTLTNYPTQIEFTKKDLYSYADATSTVKFEDEEERRAFDDIVFKLKDSNGNYVSLVKVADHGNCKTDSSYSEYRYVPSSYLESLTTTQELHTCGGHIKINHLCRGKKYTIEEVSVPDNTVFTTAETTTKDYYVPYTSNGQACCTNPTVIPNTTAIINDKPTQITINKIDNRTSESISEGSSKQETARFKVYRCTNLSSACTKATSTQTPVKFAPASSAGGEVAYNYLLNQSSSSTSVTELNLQGSKIVLRYLPANYKYVIVEENAPDGYYNIEGAQAELELNISKTVTTNSVNRINYPTMIKFKKDDIYKYYKSTDADKLGSSNKIFDSMTFVLRDKNGNIVSLENRGNGEYRFIKANGSRNSGVTELHPKNGEILITHLYRGETYYIEETKTDTEGHFILPKNVSKPAGIPSGWRWEGHPYVKYDIPLKTNSTSSETAPVALTNLIDNKPTRVVFEKRDKKTNELIDDTKDDSNNNIRTTFNVYYCDKSTTGVCPKDESKKVYFKDRSYIKDPNTNVDITGDLAPTNTNNLENPSAPFLAYEYSKLNSDSGAVSDLITDRGLLVLAYLPSKYKYILYEKTAPNGYYQPEGNEAITEFTVESETTSVGQDYDELTERVLNTPTKIEFRKQDFYGYYSSDDQATLNDNTKLFDTARFKIYDSNGNELSVKEVDTNNEEGHVYRYLYKDENNTNVKLSTYKGKMTITHLYRDTTYYIEEVETTDPKNFILPTNKHYEDLPFDNHGHPVVVYNIPASEPVVSITQTIENLATRVRFEKRDSKYNYLIPDETVTFKVYQCKKNVECHPADGINDDTTLINFSERAVINNDQEDMSDMEGLAGVEVYKYNKLNQSGVTELHPYHGILVLRYLPAGYEYVLLETNSGKNYNLPIGRDAETRFTVEDSTVDLNAVDVANVPTSLLIRKYDPDGNLLPGAQFKIYEGATCDSNLSAMNQPIKRELKLKTIRDGLYEAREETDTSIVQTCSDANGNCSDIPVNEVTKLTYTNYIDTWADFENVINDENENIQLMQGEALIQYLEYNHCYIIEEVKAPDGYSLPKEKADRFTMITIDENEAYAKDTYKTLINKPTPFTFYKFDEYNELVDGAEFKLQKLDDNKKYQDITVTKEEINDEFFYKADKESEEKTITTKNGKATVYYLSAGQYRILETSPVPGKELGKNANVATFFVDDNGNVYGNSIIVNKDRTVKTMVVSDRSQAEFILGAQTGRRVVKYGLIVSLLAAIIFGLMILRKKTK